MRGFQAFCLKVAEGIPLKTAFRRFHDNGYNNLKGNDFMTSKERAYLKSLAANVPALYQIGKDGVSENVVKMAADALAARELIKVHVLENSLLGIREAAEELAEKTSSQVVIVIGNKFVLYKRSDKNLCEM